MSDIFLVAEGVRYQTSDETIVYTITTTNLISFSGSIDAPTVVVYDESVDADVTDDVMKTGSHSAADDVITLKPLSDLTKGHSYRVEFKFKVGSIYRERYFIVKCTR